MIDHASIAMARGAPIAAERIAGRNDNMTTSHFHPFYEIYFLESGSRTYIINEKEYEVKPQTLVLLPPYTMHYSFSAEGQAFCRVVIYFEPQTLPQELRQPLTDTPGLYGFAEALPRQSVAQLIATLVNEEEQDSPYRLICQQATLTALTVQVLRSGLPQPNVPHDDKITRVMRHLSDHYMKNISLDLLAQQFYISKYHLCREFRRYTNSTIIEYLNSIRVLNAQRLFLESSKNLTTIASEVGFASLSHFERVFRKVTGMAPGENLRQSRNFKRQADAGAENTATPGRSRVADA